MDAPARGAPVTIGAVHAADRDALRCLLAETGQFGADEVRLAVELFDEAFALGGGDGLDPSVYAFVGARRADGTLAGYACWGRTPRSRGCCDLYWLAVDPAEQGRGTGTRLLLAAEDAMRTDGARLSLVEASGRPEAEAARRFYERHGYERAAVVRDFYAPGDDRLSYVRRLRTTGEARGR